MSDPTNEAQLLAILRTQAETIQEILTDRQLDREQRDRVIGQLLPHLPAILAALTSRPPTSAHASQAAPPDKSALRHWFYPDTTIGCGLNRDKLTANKLTCVRDEVTCPGCLAQLRADQEKVPEPATPGSKAPQDPSPAEPGPKTPQDAPGPQAPQDSLEASRGQTPSTSDLKALVEEWGRLAAAGPAVGGTGTAAACESGVHPIHVSAVRQSRSPQNKGGREPPKPMPLTEVPAIEPRPRITTGIKPLDHLLGGGLVRGGSFLICGKRGTGKSTLLLQALSGARLPDGDPCRCLYASAEECEPATTARVRRLEVDRTNISVMHTNSADRILSQANSLLPEILVVNTIQTIAGTIRRIEGCADPFLDFAHATGACVLLPLYCELENVPDRLKHSIDVLLSLEMSDVNPALRYLSVPEKNRFGPTNKTVCFEMRDTGLCPV